MKGRTVEQSPERREAVIAGRQHVWESHGDGPSVVLVHGIPTSPALWRRVVPLLGGVRAHAWQMVGYGDSADRGSDIGLSDQAGYLAEWMAHMGIESAVLVGHDLGGGVAQILAARHPERCAGLVLIDSVSYDSWPIPSVELMQKTAFVMERLPDPALKLVLSTFIRRGHDSHAAAEESIGIHAAPYLDAHGAKRFMRQVRALRTEDTLAIVPALKDLDVPMRLVWGAADPFQPVEYGRRLAKDLDAPIVAVPGGRHFMPEDHPRPVAEAIHLVAGEAR